MLAHDSQSNVGGLRNGDHPPGSFEVDGHRFLYEDVFVKPGAELNGGPPIGREGADIDIIDVRMRAKFLGSCDEFRSSFLGEESAARFGPVCAQQDLIADVAIGLRMLARNSSCADDAHSHLQRHPRRDSAAIDHRGGWAKRVAGYCPISDRQA